MSYQVITDFRGGLDARKFKLTMPPGTLTTLENAHITAGGEIEKRKAFTLFGSITAGTFGLQPTRAGLYVFGSVAASTLTLPAGITYQRLQHPQVAEGFADLAMDSVVFSDVSMNGKPWVIAHYADGSTHVFHNGLLVTDFTSGLVKSIYTANSSIAAAMANLVNATGVYTAQQNTGSNAHEIDVFSQPGNTYGATATVQTTANISVNTTLDVDYPAGKVYGTNGENAVNNAVLTLGGKQYKFKTTLTPAEGEVLIGTTIAGTMTNLYNAINHTGTPNTDYKCAAANAVIYAQNLINIGTPAFEIVARTINTPGLIQNNLTGINYEEDAPTVPKATGVAASGQFKIAAIVPSTKTTGTITVASGTTNPTAGQTLSISNGTSTIIYTFKAAGSATGTHDVIIQSTTNLTLMALIAVINGQVTFTYNSVVYTANNRSIYGFPSNPYVTAGTLQNPAASVGAYTELNGHHAWRFGDGNNHHKLRGAHRRHCGRNCL